MPRFFSMTAISLLAALIACRERIEREILVTDEQIDALAYELPQGTDGRGNQAVEARGSGDGLSKSA